MICPNCKTEYQDGFSKCANCGTELEVNLNEEKQEFHIIDEQEPKNKPFYKAKQFWLGIVGAVVLYVLFFGITAAIGGYTSILALIGIIPYAIFGVILWAIIRSKNRPLALGLMFGCAFPFTVFFVLTGGCGMFTTRW